MCRFWSTPTSVIHQIISAWPGPSREMFSAFTLRRLGLMDSGLIASRDLRVRIAVIADPGRARLSVGDGRGGRETRRASQRGTGESSGKDWMAEWDAMHVLQWGGRDTDKVPLPEVATRVLYQDP